MDLVRRSCNCFRSLAAAARTLVRRTAAKAREARPRTGRLPGPAKVVLRSVAVALVALGLVELGLRVTGWQPVESPPPSWFRAVMGERRPGSPPSGPSLANVVLPQLPIEVELLPDTLEVRLLPGKPPPPDRASWVQPPLYAFEPHTGGILNPGAEGWWMGEGVAYISINKEGFRDRDHAVEKEPGVFRIAVLGDSYTEAFQVPQENVYSSIVETRLQRDCPAFRGRRVEVLNFGVSGYGTTQELLIYRHFARKYKPDLVLVGFHIGTDLRDNLRSLSAAAGPIALSSRERSSTIAFSPTGYPLDAGADGSRASPRRSGGSRAGLAIAPCPSAT
jgi:hypothetical protein